MSDSSLKPAREASLAEHAGFALTAIAGAMVCQVPLLALYGLELWRRVHYQFFPVALVFFGYLAWQRWPAKASLVVRPGWISFVSLFVGAASALLGAMFVSPWFAALAFAAIGVCLFSQVGNRETQRSAIECAWPLLPCVYLPLGLDARLIGWLQRLSASFTSIALDMVGVSHRLNGTIIETSTGRVFGVAEACSGVTSFFMLVFCAVAISAWMKRSLAWMVTLTLAAGYWAIVMNSVRIFSIPVADAAWGVDLSKGILHDVLGYGTMGLAFALLLSTDRLIARTCLWLGSSQSRSQLAESDPKDIADLKSASAGRTRWATISLCVLVMLGGLFSMSDVVKNFVAMKAMDEQFKSRFFDSDVMMALEEQDLPAVIATWQLGRFASEDRGRGSDFGQHSDIWSYTSPQCNATISLDQPFPGWHELTTCYTLVGWSLRDRVVRQASSKGGEKWPFVEAKMVRDDGTNALLLFSFFDISGQPSQPPEDWGRLNEYANRIRNRLSNRIRSSFFQGSLYQAQLFLVSENAIDGTDREEAVQQYLELRETMRARFLERRSQISAEPNLITSNNE